MGENTVLKKKVHTVGRVERKAMEGVRRKFWGQTVLCLLRKSNAILLIHVTTRVSLSFHTLIERFE